MFWHQLTFNPQTLNCDPETLEEVLLACGAISITLRDAFDNTADEQPMLEPLPGETPLWDNTLVTGLFMQETDVDVVLLQIQSLLELADKPAAQHETIAYQDWVKLWLDSYYPVQVGEQLWICPSHRTLADVGLTDEQAQDAVVVKLDPGLAFGTGTHPSTAMCLHYIDAHRPVGKKVLDYGCGSGILAIAALLTGADEAMCTDIDSQALLATSNNAADNAVSDRCTVVLPEALDAGAQYDWVLANILAKPLIMLAPRLAAHCKTGGHIVLAGLLVDQAEAVLAAYAPYFEMQVYRTQELSSNAGNAAHWACLSGVRKST